MKNLGQFMKQAQQMQAKMAEMQKQMADMIIEGNSGGGMVTVTMNGKNEMKSLKIDPSLIDPKDSEMLEDLIVAAVNDAKSKTEAKIAEEMSKVTGGLKLPGGFDMPF